MAHARVRPLPSRWAAALDGGRPGPDRWAIWIPDRIQARHGRGSHPLDRINEGLRSLVPKPNGDICTLPTLKLPDASALQAISL